MRHALQLDVKTAWRSLRTRPAFALLAILTLGLGIGSVAAVFSVVNGVLLRPLPYDAADRIAILWHDLGNGAQSLPALHPQDLWDYRARSTRFEEWTLATGNRLVLGEGEPEIVDVGVVESNFHRFFGAEPAMGRAFTAEESVFGGPKVALLSHRLWTRRFGADPAIIGSTVRIGGEPHEVVGVLPAEFRLLLPPEAFRLRDAEIWVPTQIDASTLPPRNFTGYTGFGRLRAGVAIEEAQEEMEALEAQLQDEHAEHKASNLQVRAVLLHEDVVKRARPALRVLTAAVGLVLLIACGNVAQLLLARYRASDRELSVRAAIGASRSSLVRLVVIESLLLAGAGGLLGMALAGAAIELLPRVAGASVPRLADVVLDLRVLAVAIVTSLMAAVTFSVGPALWLSHGNLVDGLADGGRNSASRRHARLRHVLIVAEVALSVTLLVATGLTLRSFAALLEAEPGFHPDGVLTARVSVSRVDHPDEASRRALYERLFAGIGAVPGVVSVAAVNQLPLTGSGSLQPYAYDEATTSNWESVTADERFVTAGFLRTMGATLVAGREFTEEDVALGRRYAVIDEALATRAFPNGGAVGGRVRVQPLGAPEPFVEVIGIVRHLKLHDLTRAVLPQFFFPHGWTPTSSLAIRTTGNPAGVAAAVRDAIRAAAPDAAIEDMVPMTDLVTEAQAPAQFTLLIMSGFGLFALVLAAVGLFGVVSYTVSLRRVEFGIRVALGATPGGIRTAVIAEAARLVAVAVVLGLVGAAVVGRSLDQALYGVTAFDPPTYGVVALLLTVVSLLACWGPADRATRVDPAKAIRGH